MFPPPKWTGPGPNHKKWTERGQPKKRTGSNPTPKLPSPFSLLCNLLMIRFEWEPGAPRLRKGGGAPLSGRMRGRCHPPLSIAQSRGPSLPSPSARRGGETRCYKPRPPPNPVPLSPAPLPLVASPWGRLQARFPDPPPCLVFPGASPPPCQSGVCAQGSGTQHCVLISPLAPGFAWENPSVNSAAGDVAGERPDNGEPPPLLGPLAPGVSQ